MNTDYDKQAQKFLDDTMSKIQITFLKYGKHFIDDKENRDVYNVVLSRGDITFEFKFSQSIASSGFKYRYKSGIAKGKEVKYLWENQANIDSNHDLKAFQKIALSKFGSLVNLEIVEPKPPTAYDILTCITKDNPESFKDFCDNFGYDNDSIKANKIYLAVVNEWNNISLMYSDNELNIMREIQ